MKLKIYCLIAMCCNVVKMYILALMHTRRCTCINRVIAKQTVCLYYDAI